MPYKMYEKFGGVIHIFLKNSSKYTGEIDF